MPRNQSNHYYRFLSEPVHSGPTGDTAEASHRRHTSSATVQPEGATENQDLPPIGTDPPSASASVPHPAHPDMDVPPHAPYAHMTIEDLLVQPGREGLDRLHPERIPGTFWFDIDNKVGRSVSDTIKAFFTEPHANWSQTPVGIRKTWFKMFAQKWNWDVSITERVRKEFEKKATRRLCNTVSDWKGLWKDKGDDAKPSFMSTAVWNGLVCYWRDPHSVVVATKCSTSRLTIGPDGHGVTTHTSGQTSFAGKRLQMAQGGVLPPMTEVFAATHKRKNGLFVNPQSEQLWHDVSAKVMERETQLSQASPGGSSVQSGGLTTQEVDRIFEEVAPKKKGRVLGFGSIQDVSAACSSAPPRRFADDPEELRTRLQEAHSEIASLKQRVQQMDGYDALFDIIASDNPALAAALQKNRQPAAGTSGQGSGEQQPEDISEFERQRLAAAEADLLNDLQL